MTQYSQTQPLSYPSLLLNIAGLVGMCVSLLMAFFLQIFNGEIPCPLCMLQRVGLMMVAFGFYLNLRFGASATHYAVIILSAMIGASVSLRQDLLHIVPGSGGYGSTLFGYHLYTWGFIAFMSMIILSAFLLVIDRNQLSDKATRSATSLAKGLGVVLVIIALGNVISNLLVCGLSVCPGDPTGYIWS